MAKRKRLSNENSVIRILTEEIIDAKTNKNLYDDFVDNLMSGQIDKSLAILNKYLISLSKSDYEDLLVRVIKYNEHIGDKMHANVMLALSMIKMNNFRMDLTECYKEFYKRVNMRGFVGAKLLLEIIKEAAFVLRKEADINSLVIMLNDACKYDKYFDALNNDKLMITITYNKDVNRLINEAKIRGIKYAIIGDDENKRLILVRTIKIDNDKLFDTLNKVKTIKKTNEQVSDGDMYYIIKFDDDTTKTFKFESDILVYNEDRYEVELPILVLTTDIEVPCE